MQSLNSSPGLAVGRDNLEGVYFEGNLFVDTTSDVGYVGFVFSYQDNSKFYVVMWKKTRQVYIGIIPLSQQQQQPEFNSS